MKSAATVASDAAAERTVAWLLSLDVTHAARQELLAAGVPETTATSLYPVAFENIVPGLIAHLQAGGQGSLQVTTGSALTVLPAIIFEALDALPLPGQLTPAVYLARWKTKGLTGKWLRPLTEAVLSRLSRDTAETHHADILVEIFWYAWHLTVEPTELPASNRLAVQQVLGWYGEHLFELGRA